MMRKKNFNEFIEFGRDEGEVPRQSSEGIVNAEKRKTMSGMYVYTEERKHLHHRQRGGGRRKAGVGPKRTGKAKREKDQVSATPAYSS